VKIKQWLKDTRKTWNWSLLRTRVYVVLSYKLSSWIWLETIPGFNRSIRLNKDSKFTSHCYTNVKNICNIEIGKKRLKCVLKENKCVGNSPPPLPPTPPTFLFEFYLLTPFIQPPLSFNRNLPLPLKTSSGVSGLCIQILNFFLNIVSYQIFYSWFY